MLGSHASGDGGGHGGAGSDVTICGRGGYGECGVLSAREGLLSFWKG